MKGELDGKKKRKGDLGGKWRKESKKTKLCPCLLHPVNMGPCRKAQGGERKNCYVFYGREKQTYKKFIDLPESSQKLLTGRGFPVQTSSQLF